MDVRSLCFLCLLSILGSAMNSSDASDVFSGTGTSTWSSCSDPDINGEYPYKGDISLVRNSDMTLEGAGTARYSIFDLDASETWIVSNASFNIWSTRVWSFKGNFDGTLFVEGEFDSSSVGVFNGRVSGNRISVLYSGRDVIGDTCKFTGRFSGRRQKYNVINIGFWGAGNKSAFGNATMWEYIGRPLGAQMFNWTVSAQGRAKRVLFSVVDQDDDKFLSRTEIRRASLRVFGYSWGGSNAMDLAHDLNAPGPNVGGYRLADVLPVDTLVVLDQFGRGGGRPPRVASNVRQFFNFYQRKGGNSIFHIEGGGKLRLGTPLSRRIKGASLDRRREVRLDKEAARSIVAGRLWIPTRQEYRNVAMRGRDVGHDAVPWFARSQALHLLNGGGPGSMHQP